MYGFISGFTDNDDILYCPRCGEDIHRNGIRYGDGTAKCCTCELRFGVVECEEDTNGKD